MSSKSKHNHHPSQAQPERPVEERQLSANGDAGNPETGSSPAHQNQDQNRIQPGDSQREAAKPAAMAGKADTNEGAPGHVEKNDTVRDTVFRFEAPAAKSVLLAGEFSQWDRAPIEMIKGGGGWWHTKIPLRPGRHFYRLLVDGVWQNDPASHERVANSFGTFDDVVEIS